MAITKGRCGGRSGVQGLCLTVLVLAIGLSACAGGGTAQPDGAGTGDTRPTVVGPSRPDQQSEVQPVVSYAPTCTSAGERGCLSGTEVQALEAFDGKLYAGTTNWEETLATVWPRTSAQINVLASQDGTWQRTPGLPGSPKCTPGNAPWEQVNDLHGAKFAWEGTAAKRLFAGVLANEDGACPGLQASVFYLDERGRKWINTGLDTHKPTAPSTPKCDTSRHSVTELPIARLIAPACSRSLVLGVELSGRACGAVSMIPRTRHAT